MQNFEGVTGDDFNLNLAFTDANGAAVNISGWGTIKATFKLRKSLLDAATGVVQKTATVTSGAGGTATVTLSKTDTASMVGSYYYDVQYIDGSGNIKTAMSGVITFTRDVTRATS